MSITNGFIYLVLVLFFAQGLMLTIAPQRVVAYQMWQYRLIGAKPAEPGTGTFRLYRIGGIAMLVAATILTIKILSE